MKDAFIGKKALTAMLLLCGTLGLLLSACGKQEDQKSGTAFDVYYLNREETKIVERGFLYRDPRTRKARDPPADLCAGGNPGGCGIKIRGGNRLPDNRFSGRGRGTAEYGCGRSL